MFKSCPFTNYHCSHSFELLLGLFGNVSELWLLTLPWFSNLTLEETMSTISSVTLLIAHINSVAAQLATSRIGSSFGCIVFLAASVPGQPHDQIFQRVSTISSREVTWHCLTKTDPQQIRWALADWFGHLQSCTVLEGCFLPGPTIPSIYMLEGAWILHCLTQTPPATPLHTTTPPLGEDLRSVVLSWISQKTFSIWYRLQIFFNNKVSENLIYKQCLGTW